MLTLDAETASSPLPLAIEINEQSGRINVKSIMFAPSMLPAESVPDFFLSRQRRYKFRQGSAYCNCNYAYHPLRNV